jgi:hypothetical protein
MQLLLVYPILPGQTEACRRFIQEMNDGRGEAYAASRAGMIIHDERIWIHETATTATIIFLLETESPGDVLHALATSEQPFDRWFRQQLLALCGLDLAEASHKLVPHLISAWQKPLGA